jgi:dihydrofolate synthase / folylpolyglutamate synthase
MFTDYQQVLEFLYNNLPMFQRVGAVAYKKDLTNTIQLCEALGNPQLKFKSIHVAGTNGKGSTAHMLASVLQSAGYKTGLYTSPHLKNFTERIKINGQEIDRGFIVDFVNRIKPHIETIHPSFFEITVAMAFSYFVQQAVDVVVVEVGLGGRLDSTNVITPMVSVITNIGLDHKDLLGETLPQIAMEKAGIIKPGVPVVISERQPDIQSVFVNKAAEGPSEIFFATDVYEAATSSNTFQIKRDNDFFISGLNLPLKGKYQCKNLPGVFMTLQLLNQQGFAISNDHIIHGLENTVKQTGLKGRWQQLGERPLMICDTGHNAEGIREVMEQVQEQHFDNLHMVWGMAKDKKADDIFKILPKRAFYYFCQAKIPRAVNAEELCDQASRWGLKGTVIPDVNQAIKAASDAAAPGDFIFIGGSTFVVAEIDTL